LDLDSKLKDLDLDSDYEDLTTTLGLKRFQNRSDAFEFWSLDNSSSKSILDVLETIYSKFRKTIVQRVTVFKLGVYNGGGNCFCGVKVKVGTDTAESTNVMIAEFSNAEI